MLKMKSFTVFCYNSLLGMKFQNRSDEANCINISFHSLPYMSFFISRYYCWRGHAKLYLGRLINTATHWIQDFRVDEYVNFCNYVRDKITSSFNANQQHDS